MNTAIANAAIGEEKFLTLLADWLARIAAVSNLDQLATLTRWMQARGFNAFFSFSPDQDFRDATQMIGEADQGGLGLLGGEVGAGLALREAEVGELVHEVRRGAEG